MKTCTKCSEEKPVSEYQRNRSRRDGLQSQCRACMAAHYAANRVRIRAQRAEHRAANRERIAAYKAEYRDANRDRLAAYAAAYQAVNAERIAAYKAEYQAANRERLAEYRADNPHIGWESKYRTRAREFGFEPVIESFTRAELTARYGDACAHCGGPFEELDHYPVPVALGGAHTLDNTRPSCGPCNWAQGATIRDQRADMLATN